jgi:hypothetical protein
MAAAPAIPAARPRNFLRELFIGLLLCSSASLDDATRIPQSNSRSHEKQEGLCRQNRIQDEFVVFHDEKADHVQEHVHDNVNVNANRHALQCGSPRYSKIAGSIGYGWQI